MMVAENAKALAEMRERYAVQVSTLDVGALREHSRAVQDRVAEKLQLQDLLARIRARSR
jgi:hypothetical protein